MGSEMCIRDSLRRKLAEASGTAVSEEEKQQLSLYRSQVHARSAHRPTSFRLSKRARRAPHARCPPSCYLPSKRQLPLPRWRNTKRASQSPTRRRRPWRRS